MAFFKVTAFLLLAVVFALVKCNSITNSQCRGKSTNYLNGAGGKVSTSSYWPNSDCRWHITVPGNKIPLLTVDTVDIRKGSSGSCTDKLRFYDSRGRATYYMCGSSNDVPPNYQFTSGERTLIVRITSDGSNNGNGFSGSWKSVNYEDVLCRGVQQLTKPSGEVASNPGTFTYVNNARCAWNITVPNGKKVELTLNTFRVAHPDKVVIYDGKNFGAPVMARLSGNRPGGRKFTSTGSNMFLTFTTNHIGAVQGFTGTYRTV